MEGSATLDTCSDVDSSAECLGLQANHDELLLPRQIAADPDSDAYERNEDITIDEAMTRVLGTPCFEALDGARCSFLYTMQLTCSNVVSTVVTSRICRPDQQPMSASIERVKEAARGGKAPNFSGPNQEPDISSTLSSLYGASQSRKLPRKRRAGVGNNKYQAQLPAFRRSLPALPIPISRLNQELRQERDAFMKKLHQEREEKTTLENWAATKIQSCFRGHRARPREVGYATRQKIITLASIRSELAGMEEHLIRTTAAAAAVGKSQDVDDGKNEREDQSPERNALGSTSPWRKSIEDKAQRKRDAKLRREQTNRAATLVQACARRFLAQVGYARLVSRHIDERFLFAVVKIQSAYRGYRLRSRIHEVVARLQQRAALQIQCLVRGVQARERVCIIQFERKCQARRRAGLPLEFSLPSRTGRSGSPSSTISSTLRILYEHRKSSVRLEFKTPKWEQEQFYLNIHKVARKLFANQARYTSRFALLLTPKATKERPNGSGGTRDTAHSLRRSSSRASARLRNAASFIRISATIADGGSRQTMKGQIP